MTEPDQHTPDVPNVPPPMERAEFLVDQLGVRLSEWGRTAGDRLQRLWARTREEGEDLWAEAQDIRQRNAVGIGPAGRPAEDDAREAESAHESERTAAPRAKTRRRTRATSRPSVTPTE